jgi:hypothetical protein
VPTVGGEQLLGLSRALREMERKDLSNEMLRGLRKAAKPMVDGARVAALSGLPRRGGLAELVAGANWRSATSRTTRRSGVRIIGAWTSEGRQHDLKAMNSGVIRHPVYARSVLPGGVFVPRRDWAWVAQTAGVKPLWFTDAMENFAPEIQAELLTVVDEIAAKLKASV